MRFSSLISLILVSASLALGGCAADAEPASNDGTSEAALNGVGTPSVDKNSKHGGYAVNSDEANRTRIVDVYTGAAANVEKVRIIEGRAANPVELAQIDPAFGAHLPQSEQLSRSGEAFMETSTSSAKRVP